MKALVWTGNKIELQEKKEPEILKYNHVKIKIFYAGICGTDLNIIKNKLVWPKNRIIGHEAVGTVVEIGREVTNFKIGDRVIIDPTQYCGKCCFCRNGMTNFCEKFGDYEVGNAVDGLFTEYYVGEDRFIYKIPDNMSWETAVLTEPTACVIHNLYESNIKFNESVLIIGGGPIGALCLLFTNQISRLSVITEIDDYRNNLLKKFSDHVYYPDDLTKNLINKINNNHKFDVIIDTVGNQMDFAYEMIEKGGRIIIMGLDPEFNFKLKPTDLLSKGASILTFGEYHCFMDKAIQSLLKPINYSCLITKKYSISDYEKAFSHLIGYDINTNKKINIDSIKTVFKMD